MDDQPNKLSDIWKMLAMVIAMLCLLSFVTGVRIGDWSARPVDLFSDLTRQPAAADDFFPDDSLFLTRLPAIVEPPRTEVAPIRSPLQQPVDSSGNPSKEDAGAIPFPSDSTALPAIGSPVDSLPVDTIRPVIHSPVAAISSDSIPDEELVPIEDFSGNRSAMSDFYRALRAANNLGRPVRIAVLGDSFIEGDILTSDLRESLQAVYGGRGVGFVPLAPVDRYRNTVNIEHSGWKILSSLYGGHKARYLFNGQCFVPEGSGNIRIKTTDQRPHAKAFDRLSFLYLSGEVSYSLNRSGRREENLRSHAGLQLFETSGTDIQSVDFTVRNAADIFAYGLFLNDPEGICVDNYSLRSSTGIQLARIPSELLADLNRLVPYDLVILQYGLNLAEPERRNYEQYAEKMKEIVTRMRSAMPETSFLIMGVGDRNYRSDTGEMETKIGIVRLIETQRQIAAETGIAFWNTYLAMGGRNGMSAFVNHNPPLANKDYTHINYLGGRRIGQSLARAILAANAFYYE